MERWLPVVGFEGYYEVSDLGRVKSLSRSVPHSRGGWKTILERFLKPGKDNNGYWGVTLRKDGVSHPLRIHVLVARAFLGGPLPGYEVAHLDGDPSNSHLGNLVYTTRKENHGHKKLHGTLMWGEAVPSSKLTKQDVEDIRVLSQLGAMGKDLAEEFGVSRSQVSVIASRQQWTNLP